MKNQYISTGVIIILILFVIPSRIPMMRSDCSDALVSDKISNVDEKYLYTYYSRHQIIDYNYDQSKLSTYFKEKEIVAPSVIEPFKGKSLVTATIGPMNSSWPMLSHDRHHSGRSPYSTVYNPPGVMKWCFNNDRIGALYGSPAIDINGIIYLGGLDFFALYPNGTVKWQYKISGWSESCPVIDEEGIIYMGTTNGYPLNYLYAFYPNGTAKWTYPSGEEICSSPVIGNEGTIYYGGHSNSINALYPNGTLKWRYQTNHIVLSSPAIGDDGTVYCGCHDTYLYALYPNNGTLKWKFPTGGWIRVSPCIADDGTIYCVSLDSNLYAINPNGTMKWKTNVGAGTSPTIGQDGTIYAGWNRLYAINPVNGSVKWIYDPGGTIQGGTPCTSDDGTIYFGTSSGGHFISLNPDGTEQWRAYIGKCESAPAIGEDGTIYIGAMDNNSDGYLYAFGRGPLKAEANGPYNGYAYVPLQLTGTIFGGIPPYTHHWDFGDGQTSDKQNPTHDYTTIGNYTATFTVLDSEGNSSNDTANVSITYAHPSVTITKPVEALYIANIKILPDTPLPIIISRITVCVDALQQPFGINRVEFYINNEFIATDTSAPYQWTWTKRSLFQIAEIKVIAYDNTQQSSQTYIQVWRFF
jgi:outer membrane protein assembly factor BamB